MPGQYLNAFAALDAREGIFCNQGSATFQKYFLFLTNTGQSAGLKSAIIE